MLEFLVKQQLTENFTRVVSEGKSNIDVRAEKGNKNTTRNVVRLQ